MFARFSAVIVAALLVLQGTSAHAAPLVQYLFNTGSPLLNSGTSGATNNLTLLGTATVSNQVRPDGTVGGVFDNSASSWRTLANSGAATAGNVAETASMTFTMWFKPVGALSGLDFTHLLTNVPNGGDNSQAFQVFYHNNGNQVASGRSGSNNFVDPGSVLGAAYATNSANWHFVAMTFSASGRNIYVGNAANVVALASTVASDHSLADKVADFIIGNRVDSGGLPNDRPFDGYMYDVRAYTSVLDESAIEQVRLAAIPEPAMLSLMTLGALLLRRR